MASKSGRYVRDKLGRFASTGASGSIGVNKSLSVAEKLAQVRERRLKSGASERFKRNKLAAAAAKRRARSRYFGA